MSMNETGVWQNIRGTNPNWIALKSFLAAVRAAGSWKAFERIPRKKFIVLRALCAKGRATTGDPILKFLCELGDNGVVWKILQYWPASQHARGVSPQHVVN